MFHILISIFPIQLLSSSQTTPAEGTYINAWFNLDLAAVLHFDLHVSCNAAPAHMPATMVGIHHCAVPPDYHYRSSDTAIMAVRSLTSGFIWVLAPSRISGRTAHAGGLDSSCGALEPDAAIQLLSLQLLHSSLMDLGLIPRITKHAIVLVIPI